VIGTPFGSSITGRSDLGADGGARVVGIAVGVATGIVAEADGATGIDPAPDPDAGPDEDVAGPTVDPLGAGDCDDDGEGPGT
jgi:hypothetical protein